MTGTEIIVLNMIQDHLRSAAADVVMPAITKLGNAGIIWIVMGVTLLATKKYRRAGILVLMALVVDLVCCNLILKNLIARPRPFDVNPMVKLLVAAPGDFSFPSGHTATVFMGAELVRMEYKDSSPLYGIGAYTIACGVAFLRLYNERHWCNDVLAGAGIGILSARIGYWLLPFEKKLFGLDKKKSRVNLAASPYYNHFSKEYGGMIVVRF